MVGPLTQTEPARFWTSPMLSDRERRILIELEHQLVHDGMDRRARRRRLAWRIKIVTSLVLLVTALVVVANGLVSGAAAALVAATAGAFAGSTWGHATARAARRTRRLSGRLRRRR